MRRVVIVGAGAIGRAFLPWVFREEDVFYTFVDSDLHLVNALRERRQFDSYMSHKIRLDRMTVSVGQALHVDEVPEARLCPDVVFICVGPRNLFHAFDIVKDFPCPIVLAENDIELLQQVREKYARENVYFSIPDVIASNTAPGHLTERDPLAVVTEAGVLYVQEESRLEFGVLQLVDEAELQKQWVAKLYVHNTPHCIAAYLGHLNGDTYVHRALENRYILETVEGVMDELIRAIVTVEGYSESFLRDYATKEMQRFSDPLLSDPIRRVAREPLRKLEPTGRLLGAANLCLKGGVLPRNLLLGIAASLMYDDIGDPDINLSFLRNTFLANGHLIHFLTDVLRLHRDGPLFSLLSRSLLADITALSEGFA